VTLHTVTSTIRRYKSPREEVMSPIPRAGGGHGDPPETCGLDPPEPDRNRPLPLFQQRGGWDGRFAEAS